MRLFMKENMLQHEAVLPNSCHPRRQDETGLACEKQEKTGHHQHGVPVYIKLCVDRLKMRRN